MNRKRSACWSHPDGRDSTVQTLVAALQRHVSLLVGLGANDLYSTENMQSNIDIPLLLERRTLIADLLSIDPRGAIFAQNDMVQALTEVLASASKQTEFARGGCLQTATQMASYKLRVMTAHVRHAHDNTRSPSEHPLAELFARIANLDTKRHRRDERLNREHPFINFRPHVPSTPDASNDEEPSMVATYFDAPSRRGVMLLSDGLEQYSDSLSAGPNGFILCHWFRPRHSFETELPNMFLDGSGRIKAEDPPKQRPRKKPAAADEPMSCDADHDVKDDCDTDHDVKDDCEVIDESPEPAGVDYRIAAERHGCTVVVFTTGKSSDKAHILHVTDKACGDTFDATDVCNQVVEQMRSSFTECPSGPVRGDKTFLQNCRKQAQALRKAILGGSS